MSEIDIFLLDNSNNTKEEISMIKPNNYKNFLKQLRQNFKNLPSKYELFILDKNNEEIKINKEESFKKIQDILFIREINEDFLEESLFSINYNKLSESKQEILDEKYNCNICLKIIKKEKPFL